jgi:hypothetical protein
MEFSQKGRAYYLFHRQRILLLLSFPFYAQLPSPLPEWLKANVDLTSYVCLSKPQLIEQVLPSEVVTVESPGAQ